MCKDSDLLKVPVPPPQQGQEKGAPPADPTPPEKGGHRTIDLGTPDILFLLSSCLSPQGQNLQESFLK